MPGPFLALMTEADKERFWSKVDRRGADECWEWTAGRQRKGYGTFYISGTYPAAHRVSLTMHLGRDLRAGAEVMHSCDNPPCVNPAHLSEGDRQSNARDMALKGRGKPGRYRPERCPQGHLMTPQNTIVKWKRAKYRDYEIHACRECNRIGCARRRMEKRMKEIING